MSGSTVIVSYSELDTFRQCPLKHQLAYRERWTKPPADDSPLAKGTLWHAVMDAHYRELAAQTEHLKARQLANAETGILDRCYRAVTPHLYDPRTGQSTPTQELIEWMYQGYVQQWGIDPDWRILGTEHSATVPLRNDQGRRTRFRLKLKIDLIVRSRSTGLVWVVDHKSGGTLPTQQDLDLDDQFGLYTWALNQLRGTNPRITGSLHNAARTQRNKGPMALTDRFSRTLMNRTPVELNNIALDAWRTARAAYSALNAVPYSSPDPRQCAWKCSFRDPHLIARKGQPLDQALYDFGFRIDRTRH